MALKRKSRNKSVRLVSFDKTPGDRAAEALLAEGLEVAPKSRFWLVFVEDYLDRRLAAIHEECIRRRIVWMPVRPCGKEIWIGPIFQPPRTGCWRCLAARLWEHRSAGEPEENRKQSSRRQIRAACQLAAAEVSRWLSGNASLEDTVLSIRWPSLKAARHSLFRHPLCADCGAPGSGNGSLKLARRIVSWNSAGALRTAEPGQTLERLRPLVSPITGIVRDVRHEQAKGGLIHACDAQHNITCPPEMYWPVSAIRRRGICSGRGWTAEEAEAGCLAEAVERYAMQFRGDEDRISASYQVLADRAIHPSTVLLFSDRQYAQRDQWNRRTRIKDRIPEPFDDSEVIEWLPGWSMTERRERYLPIALSHLYYRPGSKRWIGDADSSGCAAGNTVEEAILEGVLELIERDAVGIWWYNRIALPAFEADSVEDVQSQIALGELRRAGWRVWVIELTTNLSVPVFAALAIDPVKKKWCIGTGAHSFPLMAVRRSVSELWQLSSAQIRRGKPPAFRKSAQSFSLPAPQKSVRVDFKALVLDVCRKLSRQGIEVCVFDITPRELAFPVVRVVTPGLRHTRPRFAPGRLYDVPVKLGWMRKQRLENEFPIGRP